MFNDSHRTIMELTYPEWQALAQDWSEINFRKVRSQGGAGLKAGLKAQQYLLKRSSESHRPSGELWVCKDSGVPAKFRRILADVSCVPEELGLPVKLNRFRYTRISKDKSKNWRRHTLNVFDTKSFEKASVPLSKFKLPSNYQKVYSKVELFLDTNSPKTLPPSHNSRSGQLRKRTKQKHP